MRVVNTGEGVAAVTVSGVDDAGDPAPGGTVQFSLRPHASVQIQARDLERGGEGLTGALGDGAGKWRLDVTADEPLMVMGMVRSASALATSRAGGSEGSPCPGAECRRSSDRRLPKGRRRPDAERGSRPRVHYVRGNQR